MNKTNVWEYEETKELLNVVVEQDCLKLFNGKVNTNVDIFKKIEAELKKRGFTNKNEKQIENRWRNLKNRFNTVQNMHIENRNKRSLCPFYDELRSMLQEQRQPSVKNVVISDDEDSNDPPLKKMRVEYARTGKRMPVKRNIWEYDETKELLNIMVEQESLKHFNGKHYKNAEIYKKIETELKKRGFLNKSYKQIENRWKNMKKEYCKVKRMNTNGNEITLCPFFVEIDNMLDNQISSNQTEDGGDISKNIFIEENSNELFLQESSLQSSEEENDFESKLSQRMDFSADSTNKHTNISSAKKKISHKPTYRTMNNFSTRIENSQGLMKRFFEDQKKLIDYEFNLYLQHEEELQKRFQETTKKILEENTKYFLQSLKSLLQKNNSDTNTTVSADLSKISTEDSQ